jgi:hypothetical protein
MSCQIEDILAMLNEMGINVVETEEAEAEEDEPREEDLGGLAGADAHCQALANAAGSTETNWHA